MVKKDYGKCVLCGAPRARDYNIEVAARWTRGCYNYDYRLCGKCANKWKKEAEKLVFAMNVAGKDPQVKCRKRYGWWEKRTEEEF